MIDAWKQTWQKIAPAIKAEPKKAAVLAALLLALTVLGVRQLAGSSVPASALAKSMADDEVPGDQPSSAVVSNLQTARTQRLYQWLIEAHPPVTRNLFRMELEHFQSLKRAVDGSRPSTPLQMAQDSFWDRLAKSLTAQADVRRQREIRRENLLLAAGRLRLQSTVMGATPRAMVEGRLVKEGQVLSSELGGQGVVFRVDRIEARRVIISRDDIRIELSIGSTKARLMDGGE